MTRMPSPQAVALALALTLPMFSEIAFSDEPLLEHAHWEGRYEYVLTGTPLALDTDADGNVDSLVAVATLPLHLGHLPAGARIVRALLYWGGTQAQPGSGAAPLPDSVITLGRAGGDSTLVRAEISMYSDGGAASYDVWTCRADVTNFLGPRVGDLPGQLTISSYRGLINDNASDNASAALVLVVEHPTFPLRHIALFDGNETMQSSADTIPWSAAGDLLRGSLAYYTLEGDPGASSSERVVVAASGGQPLVLTDSLNPVGNPMNQTINTALPPRTGTVGVDIDRFAIDSALTGVDSSLAVTFSAGSDKWWLAAFIVSGELAEVADSDLDGVLDSLDNCLSIPNPSQENVDGDQFGAACECNDHDPAVHPGAPEVCNGKDDNCDGSVDAGCCSISLPGDCDLSGQITSSDIIKLVNYLYRGGAEPLPCLANGDVNCDGTVNPLDVVYEVTYVFKGGPKPCDVCAESPIVCLAPVP